MAILVHNRSIALTLANIKMRQTEFKNLTLIIVAFSLWNLISCQNQIKNGATTLGVVNQIDITKIETIKLPRPNSGTYSFEDAENRKNKIYKMQLSVKHFDWIIV